MFLPTELFFIYSILIWSKSMGIDILWTNMLYNILSNDWELTNAYQQHFPVGKKLVILFFTKVFRSSYAVNVWLRLRC